MSEGPIKQARDAWKPPVVSTSDSQRVCAAGRALNFALGRGYCGRKSPRQVADWADVTCTDCLAAKRADEEAGA